MATEKTARWPIVGSIAAAVAASACCVGPLVLMMLGLGGAWVGNLAALDAYRPAFLALGAVFLFLAYRKIYRRSAACETDAVCAKPQVARSSKILFILAAALILLAFAFPYFAPLFY